MFRNDAQRVRALTLLLQQANVVIPPDVRRAVTGRLTEGLLGVVVEQPLSSGQRLLWHLGRDMYVGNTAGVGAVALISGLDPDTGHAALSLCAAVARGPDAVEGWITAMEAGLLKEVP